MHATQFNARRGSSKWVNEVVARPQRTCVQQEQEQESVHNKKAWAASLRYRPKGDIMHVPQHALYK